MTNQTSSTHGPSSEAPLIVEMRGIVKKFPGVLANDHVNFELKRGEIHGLLGENGAGKSTLMNVLAGLYRQEAGTILVNGEPKIFSSPRDAINAGIGMVHQHFMLVPSQTVTENILLGLDDPRFFLRLPDYDTKIAELGERFGLKVDPRAKVWQLSVGEQQRVEILKMLYRGVNVLIMDEPTAVLAPQEPVPRRIHGAEMIDDVLPVGRDSRHGRSELAELVHGGDVGSDRGRKVVVAAFRRQQPEPGAIRLHAVQVPVVDVLPRFAATCGKVDISRALVDSQDVTDQPLTLRDGVLELPGPAVVAIKVSPAAALGKPDDVSAAQDPNTGWTQKVRVGKVGVLGMLLQQHASRAVAGIYFEESHERLAERRIH